LGELTLNWSLSATLLSAHRSELLARSGSELIPLYRSTSVASFRLMTPLIASVPDLYFPFAAKSGFIRQYRADRVPGIGALAGPMFGSSADIP
jgi:hypothetical protein